MPGPEERELHNDIELLEKIASGNETAFSLFFRSLSPQVLAWSNTILHNEQAEKEVLQEVFIRIWLNREQLPQIEFLKAWIKRITLNRSFTYLQAEARRQAREAQSQQTNAHSAASITDPVEQVSYQELLGLIEKAVAALPPQRQIIYRMSREKGMSPAEIAEKLQLSPGSVRNATSMALSAIRDHLKASGRYVPLFLLLLE